LGPVAHLFRPVGFGELQLVRNSGWTRFPPRLPDEPIFYPIGDEDDAIQIARTWSLKTGVSCYVLRFAVDVTFLTRHPLQRARNAAQREYRILAGGLEELDDHILGAIELIASFYKELDNAREPRRDGVLYECPCCRYPTLMERGRYDICAVCFWEDDGQDDHDADLVRGGPNRLLSLTQARMNYEEIGASDPIRMRYVRPPTEAERSRRGRFSS
jgi:hypothetical protein